MMTMIVIQKTLINPDEVNEAGSWDVAKYECKTVAMTTVEHMDVFEALELAFFKTQHIDSTWFEDKFWEFTQQARSSMVGDWVVIDGEAYEVAGIGFKKIEDIRGAA
jgi:hypothetical protein